MKLFGRFEVQPQLILAIIPLGVLAWVLTRDWLAALFLLAWMTLVPWGALWILNKVRRRSNGS